MEKVQGWDKSSLIRKVKAAQKTKEKEVIYSPLPITRQMSSHFLGSRAPDCVMAALEDMCLKHKFPHAPTPQIFIAECNATCWGVSLLSLGQLPKACAFPSSCTESVCWPWGEEVRLERSPAAVWAAQQQPQHRCFISLVLSQVHELPRGEVTPSQPHPQLVWKENRWIWTFLLTRFHFLLPSLHPR